MCPRCGGVIPGQPIHHAFPHLLPRCECAKQIQAQHRRKMKKGIRRGMWQRHK